MKRIFKYVLKMIATGFVYFAIATLLAEGILFIYAWFAWDMTWQRGQDAIAVARGDAALESVVKIENVVEQIAEEQPSFEEILRNRALKIRDFELRDEALSQGKAILRQQQESLAKSSEIFNAAKAGFERQVAEYEARSQAEGLEQNVTMLQGIETLSAKVQILKMYNDNEMDALIDILKAMEPRKCAEILDSFITKEEEEKLAVILRRIRDGFEFQPPIEASVDNPLPQF